MDFKLSWFLFLFFYITFLYEPSLPHRHSLLQPHTINLLPSCKLEMTNWDPRICAGITINIYHCSAKGYREKASVLKDMLETYFPGIHVNLDIQSHVIELRIGVLTTFVLGHYWGLNDPLLLHCWRDVEKAFEEFKAFEVYINGELIFSKLKKNRFPREVELRDMVGRKVTDFKVEDGLGAGILWS